MKRKIALFVAGAMALSVLPAMNVFAKTDLGLPIYGGVVATDKSWGSSSGAPVLEIERTGVNTMKAGSKFVITLKNAKWDFERTELPDSVDANFTSSSSVKGILTVGQGAVIFNNEYTVPAGYTMRLTSNTTAEVTMNDDLGMDEAIYIPLATELSGSGPAIASVSESYQSGITPAEVTFAVGGEGAVTLELPDGIKQTSKNLTVGEIKITETIPGKIELGKSKSIEFLAPSGYTWDEDQEAAEASYYGGFVGGTFNSGAVFDTNYFHRAANDDQLLRLDITSAVFNESDQSDSSSGSISVTGLKLVKDDDYDSLGDLSIRVSIPGGGTTHLKVGELTKKNVTMTVQDKALPQIVSGKYFDDEDKDEAKALLVTVKESVRGAWDLGDDLELVLNDGVKFRAADIDDKDNVNAHGDTSLVSLDSHDPANASNGSLQLKDTKLIVNGLSKSSDNNDPVAVTFEVWVTVKPGYTGDITISTSEDNEAFATELSQVIAKAVDPLSVKANTTVLGLGKANIAVGDITVTEAQAGVLQRSADVHTYLGDTKSNSNVLNAYSGQNDAYKPLKLWINSTMGLGFNSEGVKYEVTEGDLSIDDVKVVSNSDDDYAFSELKDGVNGLVVEIKRPSSKASTFKISGLTVSTNRYLAEGKIDLRMGGQVTANYANEERGQGAFDVKYITAVKGYVDLGSEGAIGSTSTGFTTKVDVKVGTTDITVDGVKKSTNSAAAFNQDGHVYVPVRAVVEAMGLKDDQITFDTNTKTVSILDTPRGVAQFTVGSNYIRINAAEYIPMEPGTTCINKGGYTYLPFRALGEIVLKCPVSWDQSTQTASFNKASVTE